MDKRIVLGLLLAHIACVFPILCRAEDEAQPVGEPDSLGPAIENPADSPKKSIQEISGFIEEVKNGLEHQAKFTSVKEAARFLYATQQLKSSLEKLKQEGGDRAAELEVEIRKLLDDYIVKGIDGLKLIKVWKFRALDRVAWNDFNKPRVKYTKKEPFAMLVRLKRKMLKDPKLYALLGHLYEIKAKPFGEALSSHVTKDTRMLLAKLDEKDDKDGWARQKRLGCQLNALRPICRLINSVVVSYPNTSKGAADWLEKDAQSLEKLNKLSVEKARSKLQKAGQNLRQLRAVCRKAKRKLEAIKLAKKYEELNLLSKQIFVVKSKIKSEFKFYYQLHSFCTSPLLK